MHEHFWEANRMALDEEERRGRRSTSDTIGEQIDSTCDRINRSVNESGNFRSKELSPKTQEMLMIGAILFAKFCLWWLYRSAQKNDVDVTGL